ncbi:MAG TPA: choice-of-anchor D domain-containing protein [Acidimicrobiales bacterium]
MAALIVVGTSTGIVAAAALAGSPPDVTTGAYDNLRTSWDPNEPTLSPANVQSGSFGQIFRTKLDGSVYAQPLAVNGTIIVTTEKAWAYGLNATTGKVLWSRHFGQPLRSATISCGDLAPDLGSTSTPVVDPATGTVYLTTRLQTGKGPLNNHTWMQAISASTGQEATGFPVEIQGTPDNTPGIPFTDYNELQRPALLLLGGVVYAAFSSDCDHTPYRGIVVGVSTTTTPSITAMWSDESGAGADADSQSGIWQSGAGLVSDGANQILLTTGNGIAPAPSPGTDPQPTLSESVVRLTVGSDGKITATDFFSPADAPTLDQNDNDFGSGGPVALPSPYFGTTADPNLLLQEGKDGRIFLLNRDNLGGREQGPGGTDDPIQTIGPFNGVWGHPAVFGGDGGWVYFAENTGNGNLRALNYGVDSNGVPQFTSQGTSAGALGQTSGSPTVTSNGTTSGSAVVWDVYSSGLSGKNSQLRAYGEMPDSGGILPLLWSGPIGTASKYSSVTAYNGLVYVGTRTGAVYAFGTKSNAALAAAPVDFGRVPVGTAKTENVTVTATRALAITGVSPAAGAQDVHLLPGRRPVTAPGYQGSTVVPGTTAIDQQNQSFSVRLPRQRRALAAGQSITIPVTFTPRSAGTVVADITVRSTAGTRTLSLTGDGTAPGLLLSAAPDAFGIVDTGTGGKTLTFTVANSWDRPETITAVTSATAPFTVTGLPSVGRVLKPEQAVTASVTYNPTTAGSDAQSITITSDHGAVTEPLTGTAVTGTAVLSLTPTILDFGPVRVGTSLTLTVRVRNAGTIPLTISRAAAPSGVFSAPRPLPQGITLDPGTTVTQPVTFRPTTSGPFSGRYTFGAANGHGTITVTLSGVGTSS